jgi:hypothetical protein
MRDKIGTAAAVCLVIAAAFLSSCEMEVDPESGNQTIRPTIPATLPMTAAHGERLEERWQRCMRFYSRTVCDQRVRGRRPGGGPSTDASEPTTDSPSSAESAPDGNQPAASEK